jgi:hypothetical protein
LKSNTLECHNESVSLNSFPRVPRGPPNQLAPRRGGGGRTHFRRRRPRSRTSGSRIVKERVRPSPGVWHVTTTGPVLSGWAGPALSTLLHEMPCGEIKISKGVIKHQVTKTDVGVTIQLHPFVTSALYGAGGPPSRPPGEVTPETHWTDGWVGPRAGLDAVERSFCGGRICQPVAQFRYRLSHPRSCQLIGQL